MKRLIFVATLSFTIFALETTSSLTKSESKLDTWADKIDLEFVLASEQTKDRDNEVNGTYNSLKSSLLYKLNKHNEVRTYVSSIYTMTDGEESLYQWELAEVMWRSKNYIKQKDFGFDLELELKNYWMIDEDLKERYGFDGAFIPQLIVERNWTRRFSTELKLRRHFYDRNRKTASTLAKEDRIYFTPSYYVGGGFIVATEFKYRHKMRAGDTYRMGHLARAASSEKTTAHPSLMYAFNRNILLELYSEAEINKAHDDRKTSQLIKDTQVYGLALYIEAL